MYKLSVEVQFEIKYSYNAFKRNQNRNIKAKKKKKTSDELKSLAFWGKLRRKDELHPQSQNRSSIEEIQEKNNFL